MGDDDFDPWGPGKRGMLAASLTVGPIVLILILWRFFG